MEYILEINNTNIRNFLNSNQKNVCLDCKNGKVYIDDSAMPIKTDESENNYITYLESSSITINGGSCKICGFSKFTCTKENLFLTEVMLEHDAVIPAAGRSLEFFGYGAMWRMVLREFDPWLQLHLYDNCTIKSGILSKNTVVYIEDIELIIAGLNSSFLPESLRVDFYDNGFIKSFRTGADAFLPNMQNQKIPAGSRVFLDCNEKIVRVEE